MDTVTDIEHMILSFYTAQYKQGAVCFMML